MAVKMHGACCEENNSRCDGQRYELDELKKVVV
jgi:hypothetical protein